MLIATLIVGTIGLVRRWSGRKKSESKSVTPQWRNVVRRPGPVLAAVVTSAGLVWVGLALAPC